jgi:nucleoside-diphosphate-sugar epimerase
MTTNNRTVAVTGALGNLGTKLLRHLSTQGSFTRLVGIDVQPPNPAWQAELPQVTYVQADLADWQDTRWRMALAGVDAVVHFAAQNPFPDVGWYDAALSFDMTINLLGASPDAGVKRFIFATSNHVMGRYKDDPLWEAVGPGGLRPDLPPGTGTIWHSGVRWLNSSIYGASKLFGERACRSAAGQMTVAAIRIGWCQPGDNLPTTLSAAGAPDEAHNPASAEVDPAILARADRWFREMWLSNRDFVHLFERAIVADGRVWPHGFILVNGMSNNRGMRWSLDETRHWLGYAPLDDVYANA